MRIVVRKVVRSPRAATTTGRRSFWSERRSPPGVSPSNFPRTSRPNRSNRSSGWARAVRACGRAGNPSPCGLICGASRRFRAYPRGDQRSRSAARFRRAPRGYPTNVAILSRRGTLVISWLRSEAMCRVSFIRIRRQGILWNMKTDGRRCG